MCVCACVCDVWQHTLLQLRQEPQWERTCAGEARASEPGSAPAAVAPGGVVALRVVIATVQRHVQTLVHVCTETSQNFSYLLVSTVVLSGESFLTKPCSARQKCFIAINVPLHCSTTQPCMRMTLGVSLCATTTDARTCAGRAVALVPGATRARVAPDRVGADGARVAHVEPDAALVDICDDTTATREPSLLTSGADPGTQGSLLQMHTEKGSGPFCWALPSTQANRRSAQES